MTILFVQPAVGHKPGGATYPKTWIMEPLSLAVMSALTPKGIDRLFMDDRLDEVDYSARPDIVAMPVGAIPPRGATRSRTGFALRARRCSSADFMRR